MIIVKLIKAALIMIGFLSIILIIRQGYCNDKKYREECFDLDKSKYAILSGVNGKYNFLKNGSDYEIVFDTIKNPEAMNFAKSIFIINKALGCLSLGRSIFYYSFVNKFKVKSLQIDSNSMAINKDSNGNLIIFSGGNLYEYDFKKNILTKLKSIQGDYKHSISYPSLYIHPNKISYSENRKSVFYAAFSDLDKKLFGVYELSLTDYSVTFRGTGFCPQFDDLTNCLYYINIKNNSITKVKFDNFKEEILFSYSEPLWDMVVIDDKTIFFIHASKSANIKGAKFNRMKIWINGEIKTIITKGIVYGTPFDVKKIE